MLVERVLRRLADSARGQGNRREVLRAALAAAGGLLCLDRPVGAEPKSAGPRTIIVGAGFAGLACADELASVGYRTTVLEARDRTGGRVLSWDDVARGKTVEGGGELVGPNQPTWMAYAKRFDLKFVELPWNPSDTIELGGERLDPAVARELWTAMRGALERLNSLAEPVDAHRPWLSAGARQLDRRSLEDWIRTLDVAPRVKQLIGIQMTGINGIIPAWQSLLGVLAIVRGGGLQKFWDETDTMHCVGGAQPLATKLAESLASRRHAGELRLNSPVRAIRVRGDGVDVTTADGRTLEADDVVLTVPPSVWSKIEFDPPLAPDLQVPMAASTKYLALFEQARWRALERQPNAMSTGPVQLTWEATAGQGDAGPHVLVAFSGGWEADECRGWPEDRREERFRAALERLFPGSSQVLRGGRFVDWVSDPWAKGTYSFPAPGQVLSVGPQLEQGHQGRLHFAGEHACYAFTGWMEGALMSGVRTANRLAKRDARA